MLNTLLSALAFGLLAYLAGSLTFAIWITLLIKGVDVRASGSGHATTTNTIRQAGLLPGALVFILDVAKGFLPTYLAIHYAPANWIVPLVAALTVIGHCWPIFANFRGGMGIATANGAMLAAAPFAILVIYALLILLTLLLRHSARASVVAGLLFAPILALFGMVGQVTWIAAVVGLIISYRFLRDWKRKYRQLWLDHPSASPKDPADAD